MKRLLLLLALLLPFVWFAASTVRNERQMAQGSEWRIPVSGADPRDLLRGHFIAFAYDWRLIGSTDICEQRGCDLCLSREGDQVTATFVERPALCPARVDVGRSQLEVRPRFSDDMPARIFSRIFVSETSAPELDARLRDGPMVVVATLAPDGRLINRRLEPAPPAP
jgi:hypothetical protein